MLAEVEMSYLLSFKLAAMAILQVFLLGACGYFLVHRKIVTQENLTALSRLIIKVTLPAFIFYRMIKNFSFAEISHWWLFPLLSIIMSAVGFLVGFLFAKADRNLAQKREFQSLVAFQNSGYLPLVLALAILDSGQAERMLIYIFLFLLGFNLTIWSFGVHFLSSASGGNDFGLGQLFTPPVIAVIVSFGFIFLGLQDSIPGFILKPIKMLGDCTIPLGIMVVGGSLIPQRPARGAGINKKTAFNLILAKLFIMPLLALGLLSLIELPYLLGLLILLEAAMPSATSLAIISRHGGSDSEFVSQAIFITHIFSLITIPFFLGLFGLITSS
jgi:hypothetical protein